MNYLNSLGKPTLKGAISVPVSNYIAPYVGGQIVSGAVPFAGMSLGPGTQVFATNLLGSYLWETYRTSVPRYTSGNTTSSFVEEEAWASLVIAGTSVAGLSLLRMRSLGSINIKNAIATAAISEFAGEYLWNVISPGFSTPAMYEQSYV